MVIAALNPTPDTSIQAENQALTVMLEEFDLDGRDAAKISYLRNRYAGFNRKEAGTLAGVRISTVNKWLKLDPRVARLDNTLSTGKRQEFRKEVLREEWFRNFYLVLQRDAYVLKKVHGLLEEPYLEMNGKGQYVHKLGSPPMLKQDWDYFGQMRKMYTPDAWASIEKALAGPGTSFNIAELILNLQQNNQLSIQPAGA